MEWTKSLGCQLPGYLQTALAGRSAEELSAATELRIRRGGALLCTANGQARLCDVGEKGMRELMESLTRGRMHALGECVRRGYVPLEGGFRAGLSGRAVVRAGRVEGLEDICGVCIRIMRDMDGAANCVMPHLMSGRRARSALVLSAPGLGKTTLLRDAARQLARAGLNVAIADERGELAGGRGVDGQTDVLSLCPKAEALEMLVRTMRPDVIITDELGAPGDADAVADAVRCGAAVIASAHAATPAQAAARRELGEALRAGLFERIITIGGPRPGGNIKAYDGKGNALC